MTYSLVQPKGWGFSLLTLLVNYVVPVMVWWFKAGLYGIMGLILLWQTQSLFEATITEVVEHEIIRSVKK